MKKLILFLMASIGLLAQSAPRDASTIDLSGLTVFTTAGTQLRTPTSGVFSFGVAKTLTKTEDVFVDLAFNPNNQKNPYQTVMLGMSQTIPTSFTMNWKKHTLQVKPYLIVAYGTALSNAVTLASSAKVSAAGVSVTSNPAFAQNYGVGFKIASLKKVNISLGAKVNKTTGFAADPYPFVMFSRTF